ncbi:N-acetylneuraminate synthase family protein [Accumulibacter sp.]|uniref:N-acetylneuraminate synthase family protein n=1 Tax=Accumulibacter sp. TaxID=2053492 RepID=UPI0025B951DD|nr:N-acetylneuraminate synthase family protein [Accumulibacter sp.]HRI90168.1 N-acetylneuraminate synthase family protein [Accumulibacter sp.]
MANSPSIQPRAALGITGGGRKLSPSGRTLVATQGASALQRSPDGVLMPGLRLMKCSPGTAKEGKLTRSAENAVRLGLVWLGRGQADARRSIWSLSMFKEHLESNDAFVIAEVGQNHQGDLSVARDYIRIFAMAGADAVKFQTRNNKYLFSSEAYDAPYQSENAFADTYGLHRESLELNPEWLPQLKEDCVKYGVKFMSTPFDEPSLELLEKIDIDILKVASFDLGNLPLIHRIARMGKPVVMSVGGGKIDQIRSSVRVLLDHHDEVAVLHCVSEYPCEYNRLGLDNIAVLINEFPECTIGSSDHFNGTLSGPVAYLKGARVFEKHVTLNRAWKGTDHSFALEPEGFRKFVRDIGRVRHMMPPKSTEELGTERVFRKLGKFLIAYTDIKAGQLITLDSLSGRIFNTRHIPVRESNQVIGRVAKRDIAKGEPIEYADLAQA